MDAAWREIVETFEAQSLEGLATMEEALLALEASPEQLEYVHTVFRICHTVKGDAASIGFATLAELGHGLEDLLDELREGRIPVSSVIVSLLLEAVDVIRVLVAAALAEQDEPTAESRHLLEQVHIAIESPEELEAPDAMHSSQDAQRSSSRTIRIRVDTLDRLMNLTGELAISRSRVTQLIGELPQGVGYVLKETHEGMERLSAELQEEVMQARMVPVGPLLRQQVRLVRDLAVADGKEIEVELLGEQAELDTGMVEHLRDAIGHVVRNAVVHGIEPPESRRASGKPPTGRIQLAAFHEGSRIGVEISDDGRGIDRDRVLEKAVSAGLVAKGHDLSEAEVAALIFEPGLSTAEGAQMAAGRGVGMDAVRKSIEALGGDVELETTQGHGTCIRLLVPLTLAIIDGFAVGVGEDVYIIPLGSVVECVDNAGMQDGAGSSTGILDLRGRPLPYVRLGKVLGARGQAAERESVVVVGQQDQHAGVAVDVLLGECQTVIKPLTGQLREIPGLSGSTILGDGRVALILDVPALLTHTVGWQQGGEISATGAMGAGADG